MPELPEVETIRRELSRKVIGQTITGCTVHRDDIVAYPRPRTFKKLLLHKEILGVTRRAKYLIIELSHDRQLIFHLRLSGTICVKEHTDKPDRFTRLSITLNASRLFFNEPRVLGRAYLVKDGSDAGVPKGMLTLGFEPVSPEFDYLYFRNKIKGRKARIKSILLNQRVCAGVGNIYSDEALFRAGIRPLRRARRVSIEETFKLVSALKNVLREAIDNFGTSVSDYTRTDGADGSFQDMLYVYNREGQPCRSCGTVIAVKKLGNRSTRFCPRCQK